MQQRRTDSTAAPPAPGPERGLFVQPLTDLVALLPWLLFHAVVTRVHPTDEAMFGDFRRFSRSVSPQAWWLPGVIVVGVLLLAQVVRGRPWKTGATQVLTLHVEAAAWALPLWVINRATLLSAEDPAVQPWAMQIAQRVGAAIYEEFVFRVLLVTLVVGLGASLLRLPRGKVALIAIVAGGVMFSAYHHLPDFAGMLGSRVFLFRSIAGVYLGAVYWYRGYGAAAGAHLVYNLGVSAF